MTTLSTRCAVVSGANRGLGFHVARQLAERGVSVLLGARNRERGDLAAKELRAEGLDVSPLWLDVTDRASIADAVDRVGHEFGHLDILINNAAVTIGDDPATRVTPDDLRATFDTNLFGVVAVTNAFLPLLRTGTSPRIVNVSSRLGSLAQMSDTSSSLLGPPHAAYRSSKAALNALTILYARELGGAGIKVNAVTPGYRATGINAGRMAGAADPAGGARSIVEAALGPDDGPTGQFYNDTGGTDPW